MWDVTTRWIPEKELFESVPTWPVIFRQNHCLSIKDGYVVSKYTFRQIHHIMVIWSNTPIRHCSIFFSLNNPSVPVSSHTQHLSKWKGFFGWRHRPTWPILHVTRWWTTVAHIFPILKFHRKWRKNYTTIICLPLWSEQKGLFQRLRKKLGVRGTLRNSVMNELINELDWLYLCIIHQLIYP